MPANPSNPNIIVDPSQTSASMYRATDQSDPGHCIRGTLTGGVLEFTVVTRTAGQHGAVSGEDFFAAMIMHFGPTNVQTIMGHWISGIDLDTNIDQFNALTLAGMSDIDAAKATWTGRQAIAYGLVRVTIQYKVPPIHAPGQYTEVIALFTR
jgi:hypothetical protein